MKSVGKILICFSLFIFHFSLASAQTDTAKKKKAKPYKQGPSYIDAHLYKIQRPQDTTGDSASLKKKFNLKYIESDSFGPVSADCPPDERLALKNDDGTWFEKPHSVAWFTFIAPEDTDLTFDIQPSQKDDDVDFLLFKDETGNFDYTLATGGAKPVRSNIARCDKNLYCKTGLSFKAKHPHERPGKNPAYSKPLHVKRGERYYLAIDNYTTEKGPFSIFLHFRWPAKQKAKLPLKKRKIQPLTATVKVNIIVVDSTGKPVNARLKITGIAPGKLIDVNDVNKYTVTLQRRQKIRATGIAQGYLLNQEYFTAPDNENEVTDTVRLNPVKQHGNMVLQDIKFEANEAVFLGSSAESLNNLLEFMKANPTVKILIKGYVNDPEKINTGDYDQDLSEQRAKAVLKFLNDNGIEADRMQWQGFGTNDMLYPNPQNEEEMQANRRVEIEIK